MKAREIIRHNGGAVTVVLPGWAFFGIGHYEVLFFQGRLVDVFWI